MNLRQVYLQKYLPTNLRIRSESCKRHYRITIEDLARFLGREPELSDLTDDTILVFARWLNESRGISPYTVNQRLNYLSALWRWCAKKRYVEQWPTIGRVTEPEIVPRAWTIRQLSTLMPILAQQQGTVGGVPADQWWVNLHHFLWETGERIGATLQITWDMIDRHACTVSVPAEIRKGKHRSMLYTISSELMAALYRHKRPGSPYVFPFPHTIATLYNRYARILKRAGLPHDHRSKFHRMRRSFASHLKAAGGDPTYEMRHSSARITLNSYLDPSISGDVPSYRKLPRLGDLDQAG